MKTVSWRETEEKAKPMRRDGGGKESEEESGRQTSRQSNGKGKESRSGRGEGIVSRMMVLVIPARAPDLDPLPHVAWSPARNQTDPSFRDPWELLPKPGDHSGFSRSLS